MNKEINTEDIVIVGNQHVPSENVNVPDSLIPYTRTKSGGVRGNLVYLDRFTGKPLKGFRISSSI